MINIPIIQIIGYSGSGKTTFISKLIKSLKQKGLKVAAVKHDVHGLDIDREGKDSYIFSESGAEVSVVSSPEMAVFKIHKELTLDDILSNIKNVDIIIVEGYTNSVECNKAVGAKLCEPAMHRVGDNSGVGAKLCEPAMHRVEDNPAVGANACRSPHLLIGLARQSTGKGFKGDITNYDILVTDIPESEIRQLGCKNKILDINNIEEISKLIELL